MNAEIKDGVIVIYDSFMYKDLIKSIPGRKWEAKEKLWTIPIALESIERLRYSPCKLTPEIMESYQQMKQLQQDIQKEKMADNVEPIAPMPLKSNIKPFKHQIAGYNIALKLLGVV